jgi:membrane-bound metal-dependent hydrolase YbcI (DUF457 family)
MTTYEHAMFGVSLALAAGVRRHHGWGIVAAAGLAAALPDWDGLSILFGPTAYANGHRVWGHNVLAAAVGGVAVGIVSLLATRSPRLQAALARRAFTAGRTKDEGTGESPPALERDGAPIPSVQPVAGSSALPSTERLSLPVLAVWALTGLLAGLTHLPADVVFNGGAGLSAWPVPVLWPFERRGWALPIVPWGDVTVTVIFVAEMFLLYRWPGRDRAIAALTLAAVSAYLVGRWFLVGAGT